MPHQAVHDYVAESRAQNTNFGNFTKAVVSQEFQATLKANIVSRSRFIFPHYFFISESNHKSR